MKKNKPNLSGFIALFLVIFLNAKAQEVLETNPPSLKWYQVNTPGFRVIFPEGFDQQATRVANTLEHIRESESKSLGRVPRKLSVILQNQTTVSNGFVSLFPRRSEFYTMPSQDYNFVGTNDWLNLLASHEYRHVVQYAHANRGFNRVFYYLFGSTTMAGLAQAAAPPWFWEGDAVVTETAFTPSGRGKIPNFSLVFKTNLLEGRTFNYHKQMLRSYKHNIPDHYVLGYHMVNYLRKRTGDPDIWSKITARSWSVPFIPFAFSNAIKNKTGLYVTDLYREMANDFRTQWKKQIDSLDLTDFDNVAVDRRAYTDYFYPHELSNGMLIAMRSGIGNIAEFVDLNNEEKKIFTLGFINDSGMISANGSVIVWNEFGYHPRWLVKTYSRIKAYDVQKKKLYTIGGSRSRYTNAAISPDGKRIVAASTDQNYQTKLSVLSFPEGEVLREFSNPENRYYSMPRWGDDNQRIVAVKTTAEGKTIVIIDAADGSENELMPYTQENFGYPVLFRNYILYNSPATGIDNIFAIDIVSGQRYQITSSKYGAYNPSVSVDGETIYYNDQTRDGLDVVKIPFDPASWRTFMPRAQPSVTYGFLVEQEGSHKLFSTVPTTALPIRRYRKSNGIVNPYTWGAFVNSDLTEGNIGVTSQDLLSTLRLEAGYNFNLNERTSAWQATVSYQGLFPILDVKASYANRSVNEAFDDDVVNFKWNERKLEGGVRIPLLLTSSRFASSVTASNMIGITRVEQFTNDYSGNENAFNDHGRLVNGYLFRNYVGNGNLLYNKFNISAYRLLKRSRRDINSKWGQRIELQHQLTFPASDYNGELLSATAIAYFPGFFPHHSFWGYGAYQHSYLSLLSDNYLFQNEIPLPRGHSVSRFQDFYTVSANYTLPVWYPDVAVGPLLNIQRLRANVFFDYGFGKNTINNFEKPYSSTGIEAKVDFNVMRFLPQLDIGVRYSVGLNPSLTRVEVLIGTINF